MESLIDDDTPLSWHTWRKADLLREKIAGKKTKRERMRLLKNLKADSGIEKCYIKSITLKLNGKNNFILIYDDITNLWKFILRTHIRQHEF